MTEARPNHLGWLYKRHMRRAEQTALSTLLSTFPCGTQAPCRLETELAKASASAQQADEVRREVRFTRRNSGALQVRAVLWGFGPSRGRVQRRDILEPRQGFWGPDATRCTDCSAA